MLSPLPSTFVDVSTSPRWNVDVVEVSNAVYTLLGGGSQFNVVLCSCRPEGASHIICCWFRLSEPERLKGQQPPICKRAIALWFSSGLGDSGASSHQGSSSAKATDSVHETDDTIFPVQLEDSVFVINVRLLRPVRNHCSSAYLLWSNQETMTKTLLFFLNRRGAMSTWPRAAPWDDSGYSKQSRWCQTVFKSSAIHNSVHLRSQQTWIRDTYFHFHGF